MRSRCVNESFWIASIACFGLFEWMMVPAVPSAARAVSTLPQSDARLHDIIENVRQNELLYENREVVWQFTYRLIRPRPPGSFHGVLTAQSEKGRHVAQGGLIYLNIEGTQQTAEGKRSCMDTLQGYDGRRTVVYEQGKVATIFAGERHHSFQILQPHTVLLRRAHLGGFPLATVLRGDKAIRAHPQGGGQASTHFEMAYVGEEEVGGLTCHKISMGIYGTGGDKKEKWAQRFLWLAPERNYLPLKSVGYDLIYSASIPVEEGILENLQEIAPGIWFPFRAVHTVLDDQTLVSEKRAVVAWRDVYEVEKASLDPDYDISLFREIRIPNGIPVYVSKNGEVVQEYIQGAPGFPGAPSDYGRGRWILAIGSMVFLIVLALVALRRRRIVGR